MSGDERMHLAAIAGDIDEVRRLLELGVPVNLTSSSGATALQNLSHSMMNHSRTLAIMRLLIQNGADATVRCNGFWTPFMKTCYYLFAAGVRLLLEQPDVDVNVSDAYGTTPLHWACEGFTLNANAVGLHVETISLLLDHGTDIYAKSGTYNFGYTSLQLLLKNGYDTPVEAVALLLNRGADPFLHDSCGNTVLHMVQSGAVAEYLLESLGKAKQFLTSRNKFNETPRERAQKMVNPNHHIDFMDVTAYLKSWETARLAVPEPTGSIMFDFGVMINADLSPLQRQLTDALHIMLQHTLLAQVSFVILGYLVPMDLLLDET